jgi:hypothetical protein
MEVGCVIFGMKHKRQKNNARDNSLQDKKIINSNLNEIYH